MRTFAAYLGDRVKRTITRCFLGESLKKVLVKEFCELALFHIRSKFLSRKFARLRDCKLQISK